MKLVLVSMMAGLLAISANAVPRCKKVPLTCANPGSHQDVAKTPIVTNSTGKYIASTVKVYWKATDGDSGVIQGPFAINQSKTGLGSPGNGYQCEAYYLFCY